jgi:predicted ATPase
MKIERLSVKNFKSLRDVSISPGQLSVIVGPNASGKSNFVDSLDFLADAYRNGLELAVAKLGGFENIAFRRQRRTKMPIQLSVQAELDSNEVRGISRRRGPSTRKYRFEHTFSFKARGGGIRADFFVNHENLSVWSLNDHKGTTLITQIQRENGRLAVTPAVDLAQLEKSGEDFTDLLAILTLFSGEGSARISETELFVSQIGRLVPFLSSFAQNVSQLKVFQLSPQMCRQFGAPTPRPELDRYGANLPAVVDLLQKSHPREWEQVLSMMKHIIPDLETITVEYTHSRTLGLFFHEVGVGRPWTVGEVSDGTIQSLGMLSGIYDPRSTFIVIEEPENSVHPWIVRNLADSCRAVSRRKQVLLTTHSMSLVDVLDPSEIWLASRVGGETRIEHISATNPEFSDLWREGVVSISQYLESGALLGYAPGKTVTTKSNVL